MNVSLTDSEAISNTHIYNNLTFTGSYMINISPLFNLFLVSSLLTSYSLFVCLILTDSWFIRLKTPPGH